MLIRTLWWAAELLSLELLRYIRTRLRAKRNKHACRPIFQLPPGDMCPEASPELNWNIENPLPCLSIPSWTNGATNLTTSSKKTSHHMSFGGRFYPNWLTISAFNLWQAILGVQYLAKGHLGMLMEKTEDWTADLQIFIWTNTTTIKILP